MTTLDDKVRGLFDKLNARKAKVAELEATLAKSWITTCTYRIHGTNAPVNLNTITPEVVLEVVTDLVIQRDAREKAAEALGIKAPTKTQGYAYESWIEDCKKRLAAVDIREEKKELDDLENRLNSVLSPEERRRIEVEALLASI